MHSYEISLTFNEIYSGLTPAEKGSILMNIFKGYNYETMLFL